MRERGFALVHALPPQQGLAVCASINLPRSKRVKRCASCGREISELATVCDQCERWAADHTQATPATPPSELPASVDQFRPSLPPVAEPAPAVPAPSRTAVQAPPAQSQKSVTPEPAKGKAAGLGRRELMFIAAALVVGSAITFAFVGSRGGAPAAPVATPNRAPAAKGAVAAVPVPAATQVWSTARRAYWTANQRHSDAFEVPAENTVAIWMNYVRPILVVRCMNKRTEAFVYTGSALKIEPNTEDHSVNFRFDTDGGRSEHWPDSAEHDALFAPDGAAFAHRLLDAKMLRFGYTPHNAEPVEAVFHVDGLAALIEPAAKDCGWQK